MILSQLSHQLTLLKDLIETLTPEQYTRQIKHLGESSIGAHARHIIELLQCAVNGYHKDVADYYNRHRNLLLETDPDIAIESISELLKGVDLPDKRLTLVTEESSGLEKAVVVNSTFFREIVYNTEHAIHHLALIKVALIELQLHIPDKHLGMAYSTIEYRRTAGI